MPFAFPSHQGLIAPIWRRWPHLYDMPAMCVGAAMPDVVDGITGAMRGHLGQNIGHSVFGLALLCVPGGLILWFALHMLCRRLPAVPGSALLARSWNMGLHAIRCAPGPEAFSEHWRKVTCSLGLGAFSHVFFDFISHGGFPWLYPWFKGTHIFPDWWYITWARMPLPGYRNPYPIGPHFMVWAFLSLLGAYLLFRPALSQRAGDASASTR